MITKLKKVKKLTEIKNYLSEREIIRKISVNEFVKDIEGTPKIQYTQDEWMGRGCYKKISQNDYLIIKGCGPTTGSEKMRIQLDKIWSKTHVGYDFGGCIRIETGTYYPILVQYYRSDKDKKYLIFDPRPEGMSILGAILREAESAQIYKKKKVSIIEPGVVFEHKVDSPWKTTIQDFIKDHFFKNEQILRECCLDYEIELKKIEYPNLVGGILLRFSKTPYRIQNLYQAYIDGNYNEFKKIISQANVIWRNNKKNIITLFANISGILLNEGILHGQFRRHFQNVTIAGELADFDSTVVLPEWNNKLYLELRENLKNLDKKYSLEMTSFFDKDTKLGSDNSGLVILQAFELFNQALRLYDFISRDENNFNNAGTVLDFNDISDIMNVYIQQIVKNISKKQKSNIIKVIQNDSFKNTLAKRYDLRGGTSIMAWYQIHQNFKSHFDNPITDELYNKILGEVNTFCSILCKQLLNT